MRLAYVEETAFGDQVVVGNLQTLRLTGESLKQATDTVASREIRSDRQTSGVIRTKIGVAGAIEFELSYATYDALFAAALMDSAWSAPVVVGPGITFSTSDVDNSFNDSGSGFGSITAGSWIEVRGFTTAANNGYFKVVTSAAGKLVVSGGTLATEIAGDTVTITQGAEIVNGTNKDSFNFEREYTDLTNKFALYVGCMIDTLSLNVGVNNIVTGSLGIVGKVETSLAASGGAGYDAVNANEIMNSVDHLVGIYENQASINVLDFSLTLANNLRERQQLGTLGPVSFGANALSVTGSFTAYYESEALYDKYLDFTTTSLAKVIEDTAGNAYVIDLPDVKITDGSRHAGAGLGDDFKTACTFQAYVDSTETVTIRIVKFAA